MSIKFLILSFMLYGLDLLATKTTPSYTASCARLLNEPGLYEATPTRQHQLNAFILQPGSFSLEAKVPGVSKIFFELYLNLSRARSQEQGYQLFSVAENRYKNLVISQYGERVWTLKKINEAVIVERRLYQTRRMLSKINSDNFTSVIRTLQSRVFELIVAIRLDHVVAINATYSGLLHISRAMNDLAAMPDAHVEHFQLLDFKHKREIDIVTLDPKTKAMTLYEIKDNESPKTFFYRIETRNKEQVQAFLQFKQHFIDRILLEQYVLVFKNPIPDHIVDEIQQLNEQDVIVRFLYLPRQF